MSIHGVIDGIVANVFYKLIEAFVGKTFASSEWQRFDFDEASKVYYRRLKELYGTVRVLGKPDPVPLAGIFTDLFISDKPSAYRRFNIVQLRTDPTELERRERQNGLEVIKHVKNKRLFILGKPGAGKTTFLKYITLQAVQGTLFKVPIFVSLKEWSDSKLELMPFLVKQFEICQFPEPLPLIEYILNRGDAIVLFDGLDEVGEEHAQRQQIIQMLSHFTRTYAASQCLITCRIAATDYSFEQFTYVEVADFTNAQMRSYAEKWFKKEPEIQARFLEGFFENKQRGLRDLGRIPLLLSLICLAFDETQEFPARRADLYEEAFVALLKKWDRSRGIKRYEIYHKLSAQRKPQLFARIAYETFSQGDYFLNQTTLVEAIVRYLQQLPPVDNTEDIDGEAVLKAIEAQHGIFVERARQIYSFSHLTFQEYFTAKYIVENAADGTFEALMENLMDKRWREVFLLTASLLNNADSFFVLFKQAVDELVIHDEKLVNFLQWTARKADTTQTEYRKSAVRVFYCDLDFASAVNLTNSLASDRVLGRVLDRANFTGLARIRDHIFFTCDLASALDLVSDLNLKLKIDWLFHYSYKMVLLFGSDRLGKEAFFDEKSQFADFFATVIQLCGEFGALQCALGELNLPQPEDDVEVWQAFAQQFREIIQTHRDIGHEWWDLSESQVKRLGIYLEANLLLLECLDLATVSDREGIKESLLLL